MARSDQPFSIFGFEIRRKNGESPVEMRQETATSFAPPVRQDGAIEVEVYDSAGSAGGVNSFPITLDVGTGGDKDRILRYRKMARNPDVDEAVSQIINDSITISEEKPAVTIRLENTKLPAGTRKKLNEQFEHILHMLNFQVDAYDIFREWYVDSQLYYHPIIDEKNRKNGIVEIRRIDPMSMRKVREIVKDRDARKMNMDIIKEIREYYVYTPFRSFGQYAEGKGNFFGGAGVGGSQSSYQMIKVHPSAIVHVHSGLLSEDKKVILGFLDKAIKPLNNLTSMENAAIIYRLSRAPERRVFYIDVGNTPKAKAEGHIKELMNSFKNKMVYDVSTGEVDSAHRHMTMIEDIWLARRGDKGTQVETLPAGQNLGEITDILYFQKKLYKALNVPVSRLESEGNPLGSRVGEISRDELKFAKFVDRLRLRFSDLFTQLLKIQAIAMNIVNEEEWTEIQPLIRYDYTSDFFMAEQQEMEILMARVNLAAQMENMVGRYVSEAYVKRSILKLSEDAIEQIEKEIEEEKTKRMEDETIQKGIEGAIGGADNPAAMADAFVNGNTPVGDEAAGVPPEEVPPQEQGMEGGDDMTPDQVNQLVGEMNRLMQVETSGGLDNDTAKNNLVRRLGIDDIIIQGDEVVGFISNGKTYKIGEMQ